MYAWVDREHYTQMFRMPTKPRFRARDLSRSKKNLFCFSMIFNGNLEQIPSLVEKPVRFKFSERYVLYS